MKIEIDKPIIPQFVADWLESLYDEGGSKYDAILVMFEYSVVQDKPVREWFVNNKDTFITAVMYGYDIQVESLYYAKDKLTGQYLGDASMTEPWEYKPRWYVDKRELYVEKLTKYEFKKIYGIEDYNADFEEVG